MKPETNARYRKYTEAKHGRAFTDEEWDRMVNEYVKQRRARYAVAKNLQRGILTQFQCHECGSNETEGHHPDYSFPLAVVWLCRTHHKHEHMRIDKLGSFQRFLHQGDMLEIARRYNPAVSEWTIGQALKGIEPPTEEQEWGSVEDFQDTIVEYDEEELQRSQATSEDCLPEFRHTETLPNSANVCPTCGHPLP